MNAWTTSSAPGTTFGKVIARRTACFRAAQLADESRDCVEVTPERWQVGGITRHALARPCLEPLVSSAQVCSPDADEHDLRLLHRCAGGRVGPHVGEQHQ